MSGGQGHAIFVLYLVVRASSLEGTLPMISRTITLRFCAVAVFATLAGALTRQAASSVDPLEVAPGLAGFGVGWWCNTDAPFICRDQACTASTWILPSPTSPTKVTALSRKFTKITAYGYSCARERTDSEFGTSPGCTERAVICGNFQYYLDSKCVIPVPASWWGTKPGWLRGCP